MSDDDRITCHTPTPGKKPTRIPKWKYDCVRKAILDAVAQAGSEGLLMKELSGQIAARLTRDEKERLGSVSWHMMSVKLNMEVEGELVRLNVKGPQRLVLPA